MILRGGGADCQGKEERRFLHLLTTGFGTSQNQPMRQSCPPLAETDIQADRGQVGF
jgi:hypothetical protein